jgi:hypothetical protein
MECDVRNFHYSSYGSPHPQEVESPLPVEDRASYPTPGEVVGQIARVIAVCLGLGVLARVLVAMLGVQ